MLFDLRVVNLQGIRDSSCSASNSSQCNRPDQDGLIASCPNIRAPNAHSRPSQKVLFHTTRSNRSGFNKLKGFNRNKLNQCKRFLQNCRKIAFQHFTVFFAKATTFFQHNSVGSMSNLTGDSTNINDNGIDRLVAAFKGDLPQKSTGKHDITDGKDEKDGKAASGVKDEKTTALTARKEVEKAMISEYVDRKAGMTHDLFKLENLGPFSSWSQPATGGFDGSFALFVPLNPVIRRLASVAEFKERSDYELGKLPVICGLGPNGTGFVMAGGAPAQLLSCQGWGSASATAIDWAKSDIDLFCVGTSFDTDDKVKIQLDMLAVRLYRFWSEHPKANKTATGIMRVFRNDRCVSFKCLSVPNQPVVQVILRRYATVSEVLHGFDLGSAAVAYDGQELYFSSKGKLAYERGLNIVDLKLRRNTFETRLQKYAERGWAIGMLELDVTKSGITNKAIGTPNVNQYKLTLPYLTIDGASLGNNRFSISSIQCHQRTNPNNNANEESAHHPSTDSANADNSKENSKDASKENPKENPKDNVVGGDKKYTTIPEVKKAVHAYIEHLESVRNYPRQNPQKSENIMVELIYQLEVKAATDRKNRWIGRMEKLKQKQIAENLPLSQLHSLYFQEIDQEQNEEHQRMEETRKAWIKAAVLHRDGGEQKSQNPMAEKKNDDQTGVQSSEYEGIESSEYGSVFYDDLQRLVLENVKASRSGRLAGLCGYSDDCKSNVHSIKVNLSCLGMAIRCLCNLRRLNVDRISSIFGPKFTSELLALVFKTQNKEIDYQALAKKLEAEIEPRANLPFRVTNVKEQFIGGQFNAIPTTPADWYGTFFLTQ